MSSELFMTTNAHIQSNYFQRIMFCLIIIRPYLVENDTSTVKFNLGLYGYMITYFFNRILDMKTWKSRKSLQNMIDVVLIA